jgi:MFS family permease
MFIGTMTSMGFFLIAPIITKHAIHIGASLTLAGLAAGMLSITGMFARPFSGVLVDRMNKKFMMIGSIVVMGLATWGYAVAANVAMLMAFRVIHGVAFAVGLTVNTVMVTRFIPKSRLGEGMGYYGIGQVISTAVGPNIGVIVGERFGFANVFVISGLLLVFAASLLLRLPYKPEENAQRKKGIKLDDLIAVPVIPLAIVGGLFSVTNGLISGFIILLGEERGIANIGLYFTVNAICLLLVRPIAGRLSDQVPLGWILYPSLALTMLESLLLAQAHALWVVLIAAVCKAIGQGSAQPTLMAACIKKLDPSKSGMATSTFFIGADIGQGLGPLLGGMISGRFGYQWMFYCAALLIALGMIYFYMQSGMAKRKEV